MTDLLTHVAVWLNRAANALGGPLLSPIGLLPGWVSATLAAVLSGVGLLAVFKYTSNQRALKRVRDDINAHLLALKLFKDSASVAFRAQGRILAGALWLFLLAVVPMLVMFVPVFLLLMQLGLWYEARPLRVGEDAVVTVKLNGDAASGWPEVSLRPTDAVETTVGPVRVLSKREVCWNIKARTSGYQRLVFQVDGQAADKELAVGDGFMRVSTERPGWSWWDALLHPEEQPFGPESAVQSITIDYPERSSWTSGTGWWVYYWFAVSMIAALCFRRLLNVNL
jgi:hypothetical protein